jgi:hypothetical protein
MSESVKHGTAEITFPSMAESNGPIVIHNIENLYEVFNTLYVEYKNTYDTLRNPVIVPKNILPAQRMNIGRPYIKHGPNRNQFYTAQNYRMIQPQTPIPMSERKYRFDKNGKDQITDQLKIEIDDPVAAKEYSELIDNVKKLFADIDINNPETNTKILVKYQAKLIEYIRSINEFISKFEYLWNNENDHCQANCQLACQITCQLSCQNCDAVQCADYCNDCADCTGSDCHGGEGEGGPCQ